MTEEEKLARAICEAAGDEPDQQVLIATELPRTKLGRLILPKDLHVNAFPGWQFYRDQARAVLDLIRQDHVEELTNNGYRLPVNAADAPLDRPRTVHQRLDLIEKDLEALRRI
jgi:hypothetical protein